jgi:uncharacterized DUF497 family protein
MALDFEWDLAKAAANLRKHGVSFNDAATVFGDTLSVTVHDPDHSEDEDRFVAVGTSASGRALIVSYTDRGGVMRLISARQLTRSEQEAYESGDFD